MYQCLDNCSDEYKYFVNRADPVLKSCEKSCPSEYPIINSEVFNISWPKECVAECGDGKALYYDNDVQYCVSNCSDYG